MEIPKTDNINLVAQAYVQWNKGTQCEITLGQAYATIHCHIKDNYQLSPPSQWLEYFVYDVMDMYPEEFEKYLKDNNIQ